MAQNYAWASARDCVSQAIVGSIADEKMPLKAYSFVENSREMEFVGGELSDLLQVDHVVYNSSKLGASASVDPYIRLT
jgi:hypothetical protein